MRAGALRTSTVYVPLVAGGSTLQLRGIGAEIGRHEFVVAVNLMELGDSWDTCEIEGCLLRFWNVLGSTFTAF